MASVVLLFSSLILSQAPADCVDVASCRQAAIAAADQRDYERFHDLAWRAVQKGRANDPELMQLLARAQSLSGRPGDALVMLRRLAQMGVRTDARESEDFQRVRALAGWMDLEALIDKASHEPAVGPVAAAPPSPPAAPPSSVAPPSPARTASAKASIARETPAKNPPMNFTAVPSPAAGEALRLPESPIDPVGLAYDSASRRFVLGDRRQNKLIVADEVFKHVNDLIGASSAGFGVLGAVEIDSVRGDLWVTSSDTNGRASLHRLQLVSGRVLTTVALPDELQPAMFSDISIGDAGVLLLVDAEGRRLMRVRPSGSGFDTPVPLDVPAPSSIAPAGASVYVAHDEGLSRLDLGSGRLTDIQAPAGGSLIGLRRIRWDRGALIAMQTVAAGVTRLVRMTFVRGRPEVKSIDAIDGAIDGEGTALTISRDAAYYVAHTDAGPIIRRVPLR